MWIVLVALILGGHPQVMQGKQTFDTKEACETWRDETVPRLLEDLKTVDPDVELVEAKCVEKE